MGIFDLKRSGDRPKADAAVAATPLSGTRAQATQRLQVGLVGLATMILLVGLASVITERASESDAARVPEASATIDPEETPAPSNDPLADAGVVPDLPIAETEEALETPGPVLPEQGTANDLKE
ncbi:hypothetical protein [Altererythrobacter sp. ZODW24]|uniref:hypothetical protein n=1 Tax=Altererythrobacter sp. ZODW24 TaxID=2185142 RepID=UPI001F0876CC|nr:hypothetical protein [Altererythrobacter sp. ZODW24]